jgi:hypothetical protein
MAKADQEIEDQRSTRLHPLKRLDPDACRSDQTLLQTLLPSSAIYLPWLLDGAGASFSELSANQKKMFSEPEKSHSRNQ